MVNIDIAFSALHELRSQQIAGNSNLNQTFLCTDATRPSGLRRGLFDFILEKGTVDALMSNEDLLQAETTATALLTEIREIISPRGLAFLVTHSPHRDALIHSAGLEIVGVHRCYLSDEAIIINALRTTGKSEPLVNKLANDIETVQAFTEVKERIGKKNLALVMRKFMKNVVGSDERKRGQVRSKTDDIRKQDFCWIYVLQKTNNC